MIKRAMILAAGFGKRVQPLTIDCPKPLLKIGNETLLSNTLKFLEFFGIEEAVINIYHLGEQIIDFVNKNQFNLKIKIVKEKEKILDTGGGVLNAIEYFSNEPFLIINPDTVWSKDHLKELKKMDEMFSKNKKSKCLLLVVDKKKSFDKSFEGDFDLEKDLINRKNKKNFNFIYTGLQIINPEVFSNFKVEAFSINLIWNKLIEKNELHGIESDVDFLHVSTLDIYQKLLKKTKR
tara:strand:+ start:237 stop:941 length:705 start_codon:yes stop_codon:yes gene_type:complete